MGITYQTNNGLRRKVMTAPLVAPRATEPVVAPQVAPKAASLKAFWWPILAAAAVAVAAVLSARAF